MILQRSSQTALWGTAAPGEKVSATIAGLAGQTVAGDDGRWRLELDLSKAPEGPFDLVISGENRLVISDVLIGEVWLTSGQSNMGFALSAVVGAKEEIAGSLNSRLRQFHVGTAPSPVPQDNCTGTWVAASPATSGDFTAVGYYFAKNLQQALDVPIGFINSSVGGTPIEAWTSLEALDKDPDLRAGAERRLKGAADHDAYAAAIDAWLQQYNRAERSPADPAADSAMAATIPDDGKPVTLPGPFSAAGLPNSGAVWIWKKVTLTPSDIGREQEINIASPGGFETLYWNGKKVEGTTPEGDLGPGMAHHAYVTADRLENIVAIRIYSPGGNAGIGGDLHHFFVNSIPLQGEWMGKAEYAFPPLNLEAIQSYPKAANVDEPRSRPAYLFNGMIHPLLSSTVRGVVWYQGENNTGRGYQYRTALPLMIADWRAQWNSELPFYLCQLPNFQPKKPEPSESAWAETREAQTNALSLPKTGEAVLIDLGEESTVHPRDKHEVGRRVALVALAKTYGQDVSYTAPVYQSSRVEDDKVRILFDVAAAGLSAKPLPATYQPNSARPETVPLVRNSPESELEGFSICGEDHQWHWADAKIDGKTVLVWSSSVPHPIAVRYAWADNPTCNLYSTAELPVAPFRTDDFPLITEKSKF